MKKWWMIATHYSDGSEIQMIQKKGTEEEIRKDMIKIVRENPLANDPDLCWDFGAESPDEVEKIGNTLYASGCFENFHIDCAAKEIDGSDKRIKK